MAKGTPTRLRGRSHASGAKQFEADSVGITFEGDIKAQLEAFAQQVREKVLRPATYAAVKVLYDEIRLRAPVDTGQLYGAIYHWHSDKESSPYKQVYYTGVNKVKAPHWHNVEYGHWRVNALAFVNGRWVSTTERLAEPVWVPGKPYIRPAYDAKIHVALAAGLARAGELIKELMQ